MPRPTPVPNRPSRPELVVIRSEPNTRKDAVASVPTSGGSPALASPGLDSGIAGSPGWGPPSATATGHSGVHSSGLSDAALVEAAREGHVWAHEALFNRHSRMVLGLSQRILAGRDDAEDLAQDVFVYALGRLDTLNNPQAFSSWLGSIVVRTASKRLRRQRLMVRLGLRRNEPIDPNTIVSRTAPSDVGAELRVVYGMLNGMPAEQRIALVLRRVEGMELKEIAEHMGLSLATVKRRLSDAEGRLDRAMARL